MIPAPTCARFHGAADWRLLDENMEALVLGQIHDACGLNLAYLARIKVALRSLADGKATAGRPRAGAVGIGSSGDEHLLSGGHAALTNTLRFLFSLLSRKPSL